MMHRRIQLTLILAALFVAAQLVAQTSRSLEAQFKAAQYKEEVEGDLKGAVEEYKKIAKGNNRALAAKALLQAAGAYQKLRASEAQTLYQQIVREFARDQPEIAAEAGKRLAALNARPAGGSGSASFTTRKLHGNCSDPEGYLSPDAHSAILTDWDTLDVAICNTATGETTRLFVKPETSKDFAIPTTPVWSPDMRQIVYNWETGDKQLLAELRVVASEPRSEPRTLVSSREYDWFDVNGWFPDGKSVLVTVTNKDKTWQLAKVRIEDGKLETLKSLGWRLQNVSARARLSPDGRYIVYSALASNPATARGPVDNADQHIYLLAADSSFEDPVVRTAGINDAPVWTPDGKHVLFLSDRSGTFGLWSIPITNGRASGSPYQVIPDVGRVRPLGMRAGSYFYREGQTEWLETVSIMEVKAGTAPDKARVVETFTGLAPSWSPDGKFIAFKRHLPGGKSDDYVLVIRSLVTGDEKMYPSSLGTTGSGMPLWFHDSASLLTGLGPGAARKPHRFDLKTGEFKELPVPTGFPAISADDKSLYVVRSNPSRDQQGMANMPDSVLAIDLSTGQQRHVFDSPSVGRHQGLAIAMSPDGRSLAVAWVQLGPTVKLHVGRVSLDTLEYRELFARNDTLFGGGILRWSSDGRWIFFRQEQPGGASNWGIMKIPADGGAPASVVLASAVMTGFDVNPDGSRFVIGERKRNESLHALDNVLSLLK
jgi:Tol biopolymer transport system component